MMPNQQHRRSWLTALLALFWGFAQLIFLMSGAIVDASGAIVYAIEKAGRLRLHRGGEVQVSHRGGEVQVSHVYDGERQTGALCGPMREQRSYALEPATATGLNSSASASASVCAQCWRCLCIPFRCCYMVFCKCFRFGVDQAEAASNPSAVSPSGSISPIITPMTVSPVISPMINSPMAE